MRGTWQVASLSRVILCYAPGPEFYIAFWACLRTSVIAVPVYPPDPAKMEVAIRKLGKIQQACGANLCLTDDSVNFLRRTKGLFYTWPRTLEWRSTQGLVSFVGDDGAIELDSAKPDDIAFLQFTSGSTGDPKGCMISFANVWHNVNDISMPLNDRAIRQRSLPGL